MSTMQFFIKHSYASVFHDDTPTEIIYRTFTGCQSLHQVEENYKIPKE